MIYLSDMEKLFTVKEAHEWLRISRAKLYTLIESRALKPIKLGGRTLFTESELTRFIESLKQPSVK
jgi:excisionase family DNA binding protein